MGKTIIVDDGKGSVVNKKLEDGKPKTKKEKAREKAMKSPIAGLSSLLNDDHMTFEERGRQLKKQEAKEEKAREIARKSPFADFAQLNRANVVHMIQAGSDNPQALRLLLFILEHMDKLNALVCSYQVFKEQLGISSATITRAVKYLKEKGFIYVYKSGSTNVYVLNNDLAWTNHGDKTQYCKFPATVMLSAAEQEVINADKKQTFERLKHLSGKPENSDVKGDA